MKNKLKKERIMKNKYPKINVGKTSYLPPVFAIVYRKNGPHIYAGSIDKIEAYLANDELCHGIVLSYRFGKIYQRSWHLFGVRQNSGYDIFLCRTNKVAWAKNHRHQSIPKKMIETRNTWYLLYRVPENTEYVVIKKWRKLPQEYMNLDSLKFSGPSRYFTYRNGNFGDSTAYIRIDADGTGYATNRNSGTEVFWIRKEEAFTFCEENVKSRAWEEISEEEAFRLVKA